MQLSITRLDFLKELVYPVYINGIDFSFEDLNRNSPKWWWSLKSKDAFHEGMCRISALHMFRNSNFYSTYPSFNRFFKIRDFLNTGNPKYFPKENDDENQYEFPGISNHLMNHIIQGG